MNVSVVNALRASSMDSHLLNKNLNLLSTLI